MELLGILPFLLNTSDFHYDLHSNHYAKELNSRLEVEGATVLDEIDGDKSLVDTFYESLETTPYIEMSWEVERLSNLIRSPTKEEK